MRVQANALTKSNTPVQATVWKKEVSGFVLLCERLCHGSSFVAVRKVELQIHQNFCEPRHVNDTSTADHCDHFVLTV